MVKNTWLEIAHILCNEKYVCTLTVCCSGRDFQRALHRMSCELWEVGAQITVLQQHGRTLTTSFQMEFRGSVRECIFLGSRKRRTCRVSHIKFPLCKFPFCRESPLFPPARDVNCAIRTYLVHCVLLLWQILLVTLCQHTDSRSTLNTFVCTADCSVTHPDMSSPRKYTFHLWEEFWDLWVLGAKWKQCFNGAATAASALHLGPTQDAPRHLRSGRARSTKCLRFCS